jgi:hypothetical protein
MFDGSALPNQTLIHIYKVSNMHKSLIRVRPHQTLVHVCNVGNINKSLTTACSHQKRLFKFSSLRYIQMFSLTLSLTLPLVCAYHVSRCLPLRQCESTLKGDGDGKRRIQLTYGSASADPPVPSASTLQGAVESRARERTRRTWSATRLRASPAKQCLPSAPLNLQISRRTS